MTEKLSPCPFCDDGGSAELVSCLVSIVKNHPVEQRYYIRCDLCGCRTGDYLTSEYAKRVWNNRPCEDEAYQRGVYAGQESVNW